jgi:hypothetical protein
MNRGVFWIIVVIACLAGWGLAYWFWFVWYPNWVMRALIAAGYR